MASKKSKHREPDTRGLMAFFPGLERVRALPFEALVKEPGSIGAEISRHIRLRTEEAGFDALGPSERAVYIVSALLFGEVRNGGFHQYLYNSSGDTAADVLDALKVVAAPKEAVDLVAEALSVFSEGPSRVRSKRQKQVDRLGDAALRRWRELEDRFFKLSDAFVEDFVRRHPEEFPSIGSIR
jgi:hypothetical protein